MAGYLKRLSILFVGVLLAAALGTHPLRPMSAGRQASLTLILSMLTDAGSVLMA